MNPFIPKDSEFEIGGYFEEFIDADTFKFLGIRYVTEPDRKLGSPGRTQYVTKKDLALLKGYKRKPVTVKAGTHVMAMVQMICGRKHNTGFRAHRIDTPTPSSVSKGDNLK